MRWVPIFLLTISVASPIWCARGPSDPLPAGFRMFPSTNVWNTRADTMPISPNNALWMDSINGHTLHTFHADFGSATFAGAYNGIPYNIMCGGVTPNATVNWEVGAFITESDTLPVSGLPIPSDAILQGDPGAQNIALDRHLILIDTCTNKGYDMYQASRTYTTGVWNGGWTIIQLSTWSYTGNGMRPDTWTSANAAGTPMLPELANWNEVNAGAINHAIGFTLSLTHAPHLWPARHDANSGGTLNPPFGMRVRMKASVNISGFSATNQIIFTAMKKYGMFLIDNGGDWFVAGAPNTGWDDTDLPNFASIIPRDSFEVVDESGWIVNPNTMEAHSPSSDFINGGVAISGGVISR